MTVSTFVGCGFVKENELAFHHFRCFVTFVTSHICMPSRQGKVRSLVVIERRRHPALDVMAIGAMGPAVL